MAQATQVPEGKRGNLSRELVAFSLDQQQYALALDAVEQVTRMVEFTPLPQAPGIVLGIINVAGDIVPVFDIRKRFRLPARETEPGDHLILAHTRRRRVALATDEVSGVVTRREEEIVPPDRILPGLAYIAGVVKLEDGLVFIHDLDTFLSPDEDTTLEQALEANRNAP